MWDFIFFSFFNGIPYMTESDKERTPSVREVGLARLLGSASWACSGAPLRGLCWGGFSVGAVSSASVACACRWWLGGRQRERILVNPGPRERGQPLPILPCLHPGSLPPGQKPLLSEGGLSFSSQNQLGLRGFRLVSKRKAGHLLALSSTQGK